jgi:hypothetical protein
MKLSVDQKQSKEITQDAFSLNRINRQKLAFFTDP